jgi:hypothetical protein
MFNEKYPEAGMAYAMGTLSKYLDTWFLVGIIRLEEISQIPLL